MAEGKVVRIGGASGALVDSGLAVPQLLTVAGLDYLLFDYLAEGSMGIFAHFRAQDAAGGFSRDFAETKIGPWLKELKARHIRVVTNAGGLNPEGLAIALREKAAALGVPVRVGVVTGDDVLPLLPELRAAGVRDMFSGAALPEAATSANAYLGAFPIAAALRAGADIVVTGRIVDSAMALGPLIHEFGWAEDDYARLAAGTVAGHLLECGTQVTGGTFTDWEDVPDWANAGFPVGECHADGTVVITKPKGTGGLVSVGTVSEQLLYEVSDPQAYLVPDVTVDFSTVTLAEDGENRVRVTGATGYPPPASLKVCATFADGWRSLALQPVIGLDAGAKARRQGAAILARTSRLVEAQGLPPFRQVWQEVLEDHSTVPPRALLRTVVDHDGPEAPMIFWREQNAAIMNMAVGTSIPLALAMPPCFPLTNLSMFLIDRERVRPVVSIDGAPVADVAFSLPDGGGFREAMIVRPPMPQPDGAASVELPLIDLAWVRSGEKGDLFNVGVIARRPEYLPWIAAALTPACVADIYAAQFNVPSRRRVTRFPVPGIHALNFVVHDAQGGGINLSPRYDPAAKSMGQVLLAMARVAVPQAMAEEVERRRR